MNRYVALLRAVNVGGTGKLPMSELAAMCADAGFVAVKTYIASGNVVFATEASEATVREALETRLAGYAGKPVGVLVRTAAEMAAVRDAHPFPDAPGNRCVVIFLDAPPPPDAIEQARHRGNEQIALGRRELYVRYDEAMADSRLVIPAAKAGTGRNMNTVTKLAAIAAAINPG